MAVGIVVLCVRHGDQLHHWFKSSFKIAGRNRSVYRLFFVVRLVFGNGVFADQYGELRFWILAKAWVYDLTVFKHCHICIPLFLSRA